MKPSRLARPSYLLVAMLAVFAFGAIVATSAAAETKGPFWTVEGKKLEKNETKEITLTAYEGTKEPIRLESELLGVKGKVECDLANVAKGAFIAGGVPGTADETAEFDDCTTKNVGEDCKVKEPIRTEPIKGELVVSDEGGHFGRLILVEFDPVAGTEAKFATLHFEGAKCILKETEVGKGLVVGSAYTDPTVTGGEARAVTTTGSAEATSFLVKFPDEPNFEVEEGGKKLKYLAIYLYKGTAFESFRVAVFKAFSSEAKLTGTVLVSLGDCQDYGEEV